MKVTTNKIWDYEYYRQWSNNDRRRGDKGDECICNMYWDKNFIIRLRPYDGTKAMRQRRPYRSDRQTSNNEIYLGY